MPGTTREAYAALAAAAPEAAVDLASAGASLVAYACTIGSLAGGVSAELALLAGLEAASGKPAISLADASFDALRSVNASRPLVLTPYSDETNGWVSAYLIERGLRPSGFARTPVDIMTVGDIQPTELVEIALGALATSPDADSLWLPCTAMQTLDSIATIEARGGVPVVSGSQALLWRALSILHIAQPNPGLGRLFA